MTYSLHVIYFNRNIDNLINFVNKLIKLFHIQYSNEYASIYEYINVYD